MQGWALAASDLAKGAVEFPTEGGLYSSKVKFDPPPVQITVYHRGHQWVYVTSSSVVVWWKLHADIGLQWKHVKKLSIPGGQHSLSGVLWAHSSPVCPYWSMGTPCSCPFHWHRLLSSRDRRRRHSLSLWIFLSGHRTQVHEKNSRNTFQTRRAPRERRTHWSMVQSSMICNI